MKMPEKQESQKNPIVFLDIKIDKLEGECEVMKYNMKIL